MAWLRMARRFTRGGAARLALTVLAVAWGVALVAAVHLANRAVLRAFVEVVDTMAGRAALEVVAGEGGLFPEDVAAAVATVPGVEVSAASVKAAAIARRVPAGLRVQAPAQRQTDLRRVTESLRTALQALGLFGLVAAFLITFNRLSTVFEERAWQLGVLRAVGLRTGAVWRSLVGESLLVGAAGVAVGIPLGLGLGRLLVPVIATASAVAQKLVAPPATLALEPGPLLLAGALGLGTTVLAAALPAWRAARVALAETMRSRGKEAPGASPRVLWVLRGVALATASVSLAALAWHPAGCSGLLTTALAAVGTALAARPAVQVAGFLLGAGARRVAGPVGRFGAASLLHNPRRTALTVATLGVGLGCVEAGGTRRGGGRVGELPHQLRGARRRAGGARHPDGPARARDRRRDARLRVARRDHPHEPRGVRPLLAGPAGQPRRRARHGP